MAKIKKIIAREILDSRGYPTVESIVELSDSAIGVSSVPSGLSVGRHEATELRDNDPKRYLGRGVLKCLENILNVLAPRLIGKEASLQKQLDEEMIAADSTPDKTKLGANSILSLSCAIAKAEASSQKIPLYQYIATLLQANTHEFSIPTPMFNILNGGKHGCTPQSECLFKKFKNRCRDLLRLKRGHSKSKCSAVSWRRRRIRTTPLCK